MPRSQVSKEGRLAAASWGLHLADVNIALGDLVDLVARETRAYLRQRARRK